MKASNLDADSLARLFSKIKKDPLTQCWIWTGHLNKGYGEVRVKGRLYKVHRLIYALFVGPIPDGKGRDIPVLDHICNNPPCCNPAHLQLISDAKNTLLSGGITAQKYRKTHCKNGHLLPPPVKGHRRCPICNNAWSRARYAKRRANLRQK